jgi:iron complex transport system substrate-binding protein
LICEAAKSTIAPMSHTPRNNLASTLPSLRPWLLRALLAVLLAYPAACEKRQPPQPDAPAPRIISYSPALTDIVFGMGLGDHVVAVTNFCHLPPGEQRDRVGDRQHTSAESILAMEPNLLLIQQNPEPFEAVRRLDDSIRVEHFDIETLTDVAEAIERVGELVDKPDLGRRQRACFEQALAGVQQRVAARPRPRVLFVMGYDRPSTGGEGTFIDEMIAAAGGTNAAAEAGYSGWANLHREAIQKMAPEVLVCWVDNRAAADEALAYWRGLELPAGREGRIFIVTDARWTIPSMRSADFVRQLAAMLHPEAFDENAGDIASTDTQPAGGGD